MVPLIISFVKHRDSSFTPDSAHNNLYGDTDKPAFLDPTYTVLEVYYGEYTTEEQTSREIEWRTLENSRFLSPFTTPDNVNLAPDTFMVIRTNWPFLTPYIQNWKYVVSIQQKNRLPKH